MSKRYSPSREERRDRLDGLNTEMQTRDMFQGPEITGHGQRCMAGRGLSGRGSGKVTRGRTLQDFAIPA